MTQDTQQEPKEFTVSREVLVATIDYLAKQPYHEVAPLIQRLAAATPVGVVTA